VLRHESELDLHGHATQADDMHDLAGVHVPLVTPFTEAGGIAVEALESLAHNVIHDGAAGIVALGTTGEAATLTPAERRTVLDVCASVSEEQDHSLIAGAGSNDTLASARSLAELAHWPAVSAALVVVPYFSLAGEAGVIAHFEHLAAESPVPLIIYNVPARTGQRLGVTALRELAGIDGVIGIKHAVGGIDADTIALLAGPPPSFAVLAGDDITASPLLALGATGAILASAHVLTDQFADLATAWRDGPTHRARALGHRLAQVSAALFAAPNPTVIKAVLHAQGRIPTPAVRLPLLPASPSTVDAGWKAVSGELSSNSTRHSRHL
jgi:4-hydroxy-tetrahydrodipicolinate synthase